MIVMMYFCLDEFFQSFLNCKVTFLSSARLVGAGGIIYTKKEWELESSFSVPSESCDKRNTNIIYSSFYKLVPRVKNTPRS